MSHAEAVENKVNGASGAGREARGFLRVHLVLFFLGPESLIKTQLMANKID